MLYGEMLLGRVMWRNVIWLDVTERYKKRNLEYTMNSVSVAKNWFCKSVYKQSS